MTTPAPVQSIYRNRIDELADKYLFIVVFLVGALGVIALKAFGVSQILVTAVPLTGMAIYGLYILFTPKYRIRNDRAGDSLYYLGFLFTMVSLAYSLYEFGGSKGTESIVTNFGIALSTTILGLMLRVAYHQLREDPFEVEREVRIELADAAGKLRGELLTAAADFKALSTASLQTLEEISNATNTKINRVVDNTTASYSKAVSELTDLVRASTSLVRDQQASIRQAGSRTVGAMERLAERIEKTDFPVDHLAKQVQQLTSEITSSFKALSERSKAEHQRIAEFETIIANINAVLNNFAGSIGTIEVNTARYADTAKNAGAALDTLTAQASASVTQTLSVHKEHSEQLSELVNEMRLTVESAARASKEHRIALENDVRASTEMLTQVENSFIKLARTVIEKLDAKPVRS